MFHSEDAGAKMAQTINELTTKVRETEALANEYARQLACSDKKYLEVAEMLLKSRKHGHGWKPQEQPWQFLECPVCRGIYMLAPHRLRAEILAVFENEALNV